ncbi:alcohol dehydrogenase catalytic domain-containing protein [Spirosoma sp. HMF4905]|uniref:Alcohol dehydrogenase catalytic domain-containing protein n=1 Tax=Spirosoma arboris TaxID=2682092 RepID=A0A7K1S9P5_9BACT|nr:alcohol dehydrogenase catalytic domain-containing protein [Spirosoma arboris]MVM30554.1 alcohol dehydrogenase catalytic domain-containing protein [Spirosoma arboris]
MSDIGTSMQAGLLTAARSIGIQQRPIPEPGPGEVRLKMKLVGICGSDVSIFQGHRPDLKFPLIIGHEGIGYVDKLGDGVSHLQPGERVVIEPNYPCGHCDYCWQGRGNICINKRIIGVLETGCFAEYAVISANFAWRIPDTISDEDAVVIEPTAVALHTLYSSPARPGDTIAVVGLGAIGLLVTHLAQKMGYTVLAYDRVQEKVNLASSYGAIPISADATTALIAAIWKGANVHTVFECAGAAPAFTLSVEAAPRGAYVVVAGLSDKPSAITEFGMTRQGINIITSIIYQHPVDFRRTIGLIETGFIQPGRIISARESFSNLPSAIEVACAGQHAKIVLTL